MVWSKVSRERFGTSREFRAQSDASAQDAIRAAKLVRAAKEWQKTNSGQDAGVFIAEIKSARTFIKGVEASYPSLSDLIETSGVRSSWRIATGIFPRSAYKAAAEKIAITARASALINRR